MWSFRSKSRIKNTMAGVALALAFANPGIAQDFSVAVSAPPSSLDPHFYYAAQNVFVSLHMFEALTKRDADSKVVPSLAESWRLVNDRTWEFKLRKGVKFHDGSTMTAEDVLWSIERPATIVGSPGKFDIFTKPITETKIVDPHTVQFVTKDPSPLLPVDLSAISIVSKAATQGVKSEEFASGKGLVGTGPFKFVSFGRDDRVIMKRNDQYWGEKPAWENVTLRFIPSEPTRIASLLAGDVDAIEGVPPSDIARVRNDKKLSIFSKPSHRIIYVYLDLGREKTPFATDMDGKTLERNPLMNLKVRQALSMAINRAAIKDYVMEGLAFPTTNLTPSSFTGHNPAAGDVKFNPDGAKKLLAEAGYPDGFQVTLHAPNNRYVNDEKIAQTIAQMWSKAGVRTKVEALPISVFASHSRKGTYSAGLFGWGTMTGEMSNPLRALLACPDPEKGMGGFNSGRYCNPEMDKQLSKALHTVDNGARARLLQEASATALNDVALIPIHLQVNTWATRKGIVYTPRVDEGTLAYEFRPQ